MLYAIGDIHGMGDKLEQLIEKLPLQPGDQLVFIGDYVDRGSGSLPVLMRIMEMKLENWDRIQMLRGNHEDYLLRCGQQDFVTNGPTFELNRFAYFAYQQLNGEEKELAEMPERFSWFAPDGSEFRVVHASMRDNRDGIYKGLTDDELRLRIAPSSAVFVTGHTHQSLMRQLTRLVAIA